MNGLRSASIGIDVGGTKSLGVVLDDRNVIVHRDQRPTPAGAAAIVDVLAELVTSMSATVASSHRISRVGVGIAGLVDRDGVLHRAPNLVDADGLAVRDLLEPRVGVPVQVDNDANCVARAELAIGVAHGVSQALLVTLGTGIGGAVIVDGAVSRGANGMAGEPGHMLVDPHGPRCVCGLRGCWERYASGAGLAYLAELAEARGELSSVRRRVGATNSIRGEHITSAVRDGDSEAAAVLGTFAWWVATGIASCAALIDPELVIVGGGLVRDWDLFGAATVGYLDELLLAAAVRPAIRLEPATAGDAAGAVGAALLGSRGLTI